MQTLAFTICMPDTSFTNSQTSNAIHIFDQPESCHPATMTQCVQHIDGGCWANVRNKKQQQITSNKNKHLCNGQNTINQRRKQQHQKTPVQWQQNHACLWAATKKNKLTNDKSSSGRGASDNRALQSQTAIGEYHPCYDMMSSLDGYVSFSGSLPSIFIITFTSILLIIVFDSCFK